MFNNKFNIKNLVNRITNNSEEGGNSGDGPLASSPSPDDQHSAEGFLCPLCMTAFSSPDALQAHYVSSHPEQSETGESTSQNSESEKNYDVKELLQNITELHQLIENQRQMSMAFEVQCGELQTSLTTKEDEAEKLKVHEKELQKSNELLSSEINLLRQQLTEQLEQASLVRKDKDQTMVNLTSELDVIKQENSSLKIQLAHKNSVDDTEVLRLELVKVQKAMDENSLEKEKEIEVLKNQIGDLNNTVQENDKTLRAAQLDYLEKIKAASAIEVPEIEDNSSVEEYKTTIQQLRGETEKLRTQLNEYEEILAAMNSQKDDLETANVQIIELNKNIHNLKLALSQANSERDNAIRDLESERNKGVKQTQELEEKLKELDNLTYKFEGLTASYDQLSNARLELAQQYKELKESCGHSAKELDKKKSEISILIMKLTTEEQMHKETMDDCKKVKNAKDNEIKLLKAECVQMAEAAKDAKDELSRQSKAAEQTGDQYKDKIIGLENQAKVLNEKLELAIKQKEELQNLANEIQAKLQNEIDELIAREDQYQNQIQENKNMLSELKSKLTLSNEKANLLLEETKTLLNAKLELESNVLSVNEKYEQLNKANEEIQATFEKSRTEFQKQVDELRTKEKDFQLQLQQKENGLQQLKAELEESNERRSTMQSQTDAILVEKLEYEKNLKSIEQRNALLMERCLSSDNEKEKLHDAMSDLKRKLEDSTAALQELGRENQALAMESYKMNARQWADDALATNCTTCSKEFTLTFRKHHCRQCGQIYCKDCSSKTAKIPSFPSKNPVRVCDACYEELR